MFALPYSMFLQVHHTSQCLRLYFPAFVSETKSELHRFFTGLNVRVMDIEVVLQMKDGEAFGKKVLGGTFKPMTDPWDWYISLHLP